MNLQRLTIRNIARYRSFYRLIAVAVSIAVAVITGSLAVGDSVRANLINRVEERLGNIETVIFSKYSYMDAAIVVEAKLGVPSLSVNGFVSVSGKFIPVTVWGRDDMDIKKGETKINRALFNEIQSAQTKELVLRLPAAGMVPSGAMYVSDTYTTSLRLTLDSVISIEQGGNISLKNEHAFPRNVFVNLEELAEAMKVDGKINLILSDRIISQTEFATKWNYACSGLNVNTENQIATITSDRIFIQDKVVETLCRQDSLANRYFSYFANSIRYTCHSIPYSFITAVDYYNGQRVSGDEIILSDYAAQRLNARLGDTVSVSFFVSRRFKTLFEDSVFLKVGSIVPLKDLQTDHTLAAEFPGLSDVEQCTDWDSDLPINMNLITDEDVAYWEQYRNTPKAIVSYAALAPRWKNAFGSATALQIGATNRLEDLTYQMFDIQVMYPRDSGIIAAQSGVDFSSLFLFLGFFIIISAALLLLVPLSEMLFFRSHELSLLSAFGFSNKRITSLLWRESIPIVFFSALAGALLGLLYTFLLLFLLGTVWKGATHTDGFGVYPDFITIAASVLTGIFLSLLLLYTSIVRTLQKKRILKLFTFNYKFSIFNFSRLIWASISYRRKQALLSFISLASGVLIVFSAGLSRQGFSDSAQMRAATGGFSFWCETAIPIYHNLQTEAGRAKLALTDLPEKTKAVQLLKYSADDASCLNLNKAVSPNVLGIDMDELKQSDFKISKTIFKDIFERLKCSENSVYPALVDETVLRWSLGKKLGDTIAYLGEKGDSIAILLAGTLQNSIFQGYILIDKTLFSEIWNEISGSEIILVKTPETDMSNVGMLFSQALNNYGARVIGVTERLKIFNSVSDTYLAIFLTLGGLGLLLGIFSFIIVVRKNLLSRTKEIMLYDSLGFDKKRIYSLLYKENLIIPLCAIFTGALGALAVVSKGLGNTDIWTWSVAAIFLALFIGCVLFFVKKTVWNSVRKI